MYSLPKEKTVVPQSHQSVDNSPSVAAFAEFSKVERAAGGKCRIVLIGESDRSKSDRANAEAARMRSGAGKDTVTERIAKRARDRHQMISPARRVIQRFISLGVAGSALALAACSLGGGNTLSTNAIPAGDRPQETARAGSPVEAKVALLLPLSGTAQATAVAKGMKQAAEMAMFELNNPAFQMVVKDTQGTPEGAAAAATQAAADGAELIIGPLFAKSVRAVQPIAAQAGMPVIAFSNDRSVAGNGVYLLSFMAEEEVDRIVSFAAGQGKRGLAALIPDNAYGKIMEAAFRTSAQRNGAQIVALERYPVNSSGMLAPSQKLFERVQEAGIQGLPVDAIFLPGGPETLPNLTPLITYANASQAGLGRPKFLGSGGWDYPNLGRTETLVGSWYPAPDPRGWKSFSGKFSRTFGAAPPRIATLAHDALTVATRLATQHPRGVRYQAQAITRPTGFIGIDGPFRFNADGTTSHSLAVLEVQRFQSIVVDPAKASFSSRQLSSATTGALVRQPALGAAMQN
jgi:branched-chain amino acid transport system substrate-binding protein